MVEEAISAVGTTVTVGLSKVLEIVIKCVLSVRLAA